MAAWRLFLAALLMLLGSPGLLHGHPQIIKEENMPQLGGWKALLTTGNTAKRMAEFVELQFNAEDGQCPYQTTEIQSVAMQVVNGFNYRLKLKMEKTGCNKEVVVCDILIFETMRDHMKTIQEKNCTPA